MLNNIRIVIVDDNPARCEQILSMLPAYASGNVVPYGTKAMAAIRPNAEGKLPDLIIMNADDVRDMGLYMFDWLKNKEKNLKLYRIPVLLLTENQYSDKSMDYLEMGDAIFYEGEIDEERLFFKITETLEAAEFLYDENETTITIPKIKSADRLMGTVVSAPKSGESGEARSVVLNMQEHLEGLENALEMSRESAITAINNIKEAIKSGADVYDSGKYENIITDTVASIRATNKVREDMGLPTVGPDDDIKDFARDKSQSSESSVSTAGESKVSSDNRLQYRNNSATRINTDYITQRSNEIRERIKKANAQKENDRIKEKLNTSSDFNGRRMLDDAWGANNKESMDYGKSILDDMKNKMLNESADAVKAHTLYDPYKKKIVVVDDDPRVAQTIELYIGNRYNIIGLESGMKAIDYFVNSSADLLLLDAVMPNMKSTQVLSSIRWQKNGKNVPVVFMVGNDYMGGQNELMMPGVAGMVRKPVSAGNLAMVVDATLSKKW